MESEIMLSIGNNTALGQNILFIDDAAIITVVAVDAEEKVGINVYKSRKEHNLKIQME